MEKIIKFKASIDAYLLCIENNTLSIKYETKSLDSNELYKYFFKNIDRDTTFRFESELEESFEKIKNEINVSMVNRVLGEGNFIFGKIQKLIQVIHQDIQNLFCEDNEIS